MRSGRLPPSCLGSLPSSLSSKVSIPPEFMPRRPPCVAEKGEEDFKIPFLLLLLLHCRSSSFEKMEEEEERSGLPDGVGGNAKRIFFNRPGQSCVVLLLPSRVSATLAGDLQFQRSKPDVYPKSLLFRLKRQPPIIKPQSGVLFTCNFRLFLSEACIYHVSLPLHALH